jgi:PhzF family phenazine biosynthesis protein
VSDGNFHIRWFSLESEINLCGHGSLGAGAALLSKYGMNEVVLNSKHGDVVISEKNGSYTIVLPSWQGKVRVLPSELSGLTNIAVEVFTTRDLVIVLPSEELVANFKPDYERLKKTTDYHALIVTAQSGKSSYVLRYFAPKIGIAEDRATGSAQCSLAPYWFSKLGVNSLSVRQLSSSGGYFQVERKSDTLIEVFAQVKVRVPAI